MKIFLSLAAVSLLLVLFWTFKLYFGFAVPKRLPQANKSLESPKPADPKPPERPVLVTNHPAGKSLSFAAVKNLLLTTNRQNLGGVGKIVTAKHGFYGYQIVRLPPTVSFTN